MPDLGLSNRVIGLAVQVHRRLGPGLLEAVYEECLCFELKRNDIAFDRQVAIPVVYDDVRLECGFRIDVLVERTLILEIKSIEKLAPLHSAQLLTYLRLSALPMGLLINFNVPILKEGLRRLLNTNPVPPPHSQP